MKNIVNHFEKGEKLRPWVKEWIISWSLGNIEDLEIPEYFKPNHFMYKYRHHNTWRLYNQLWNPEITFPHYVEFRENHKTYIDSLYEYIELTDAINASLKIKKYRVRYLRVETTFKGIRCRKVKTEVYARNIQEALSYVWVKPRKGSSMKISKIKEGPLVGKYKIEPWNIEHLKIPYMMEKFKGRY